MTPDLVTAGGHLRWDVERLRRELREQRQRDELLLWTVQTIFASPTESADAGSGQRSPTVPVQVRTGTAGIGAGRGLRNQFPDHRPTRPPRVASSPAAAADPVLAAAGSAVTVHVPRAGAHRTAAALTM